MFGVRVKTRRFYSDPKHPRAPDMVDDDIGDIDASVTELSNVFNNPSAEGFLATVKNSIAGSPAL